MGCPQTAHCSVLGTVKNSPEWLALDQKRPCVVCMKLCEMNGLSWLIKEINRLMHECVNMSHNYIKNIIVCVGDWKWNSV